MKLSKKKPPPPKIDVWFRGRSKIIKCLLTELSLTLSVKKYIDLIKLFLWSTNKFLISQNQKITEYTEIKR
jgi:hypothetical protein